ncbi:MAG TPA: tetratricopeptide repeat protein [Methylibium sp.]|nr:tetratricopeptide repeat protein [Methylibium sp.]
MPVFRLAALAFLACTSLSAIARSTDAADEGVPIINSALDAPLFYQLLVGEIELRDGDVGTAYQVLLDAARKTGDERLFRRATEVALQAKAGEEALAAVRAWRTAVPKSGEAHRYEVQILLALNRLADVVAPLRATLALVPADERADAIQSLTAFFGRTADRQGVVAVLEPVLRPYAEASGSTEPAATAVAAWVTLGRARQAAGDVAGALEAARRGAALAPNAESVALLAIALMRATPDAEGLVQRFLAAEPPAAPTPRSAVRLVYARALALSQRYVEATPQLETVTRDAPQLLDAWLTLGALYLELRRPADAEAVLREFLARSQKDVQETPAAAAEDDDAATPAQRQVQAYLMLAQAAEQRRDFKAAEAWLAKVDGSEALTVQARRASLLAKQGKLGEARELLRRLPERSPEEARAKLLAEAHLLREQKQWAAAHGVLADALRRFPDDADLLYEQAMMAEKLDRFEQMEQLLRRIIALKPDHAGAYNALGYTLADRNERLAEAKALIERALLLTPGDPFLVDSLGWVEYRLGNHEVAIQWLRQAYRARPDTEIAAHLGEVLWVAGQRDEARKVWAEARARDAGNDLLQSTLARLKVDL